MAQTGNTKTRSRSGRRPARTGRKPAAAKTANQQSQTSVASRVIKYALAGLAALAVILLILTWYFKVYASPKNVFWGMLNNNLSTLSVSKQSSNSSGSATNDEITQLSFNPDLKIHDIKQISDNSTNPTTKLTVEAIGTPQADYQRYSHIERANQKGAKADYSQVYKLWLKNGGSPNAQPQIVASNLFGPILFGNLSSQTRASLMQQLPPAYKVDFSKTTKKMSGGRQIYRYTVSVKLKAYAQAAESYAKSMGLPLAQQIDPQNYKPTDQLAVIFNIDVMSRQLKSIEYISNGVTEHYSGYGDVVTVDLPARTVDAKTFQNALNSVR